MKSFVVVALFALASSVSAFGPLQLNYHEEIGIPLAASIKRAEESTDFDGARIVGGSLAGLGTHPHLAGCIITLTTGQTSICGASLLSNNRAVTAAHCWRTPTIQGRQMTLVYGSVQLFSGGVRINTNNIVNHPSFVASSLQNDVAMITHQWVGFTNVIQPIFLPPNHLLNNQFVGTWAWAAGFGRISDDFSVSNSRKHQVAMQVITNAACARVYGAQWIFPSTLCVDTTGGRSTCTGDSGGPLAFTYGGRRTLIGITSWVGGRCAGGQPAGFARVTSFAAWIRSRM